MKVTNFNPAGGQTDMKVYNENNPVKNEKIKENGKETPKASEKEKDLKPAVVYEKSDEAKALEKTKKEKTSDKVKNTKTIEYLQKQSEERVNNFKKMIRDMLEKQGYHFNRFMGSGVADKDGNEVKLEDIKVDEDTRMQAQKAISEGGEYSVENVATRIMDFAKALAGGDKSKIGMLRKAVQDGFEQAKQMLGGTLPEISMKTYDEVMARFDEWENPSKVEETPKKA